MSQPEEHKPDSERDSQAFAGLRPGGMVRGRMQPHEKQTLRRLVPIGLAIVALYAAPTPDWWPGLLTLGITLLLFVAGVTIVARGINPPR